MTFNKIVISLFVLIATTTPVGLAQVLSNETPAVVQLTGKLDSERIPEQLVIWTKLVEGVRFPDGTSIPRGTQFSAIVTRATPPTKGKLALVFRFTEARHKKRMLPIRATILDLSARQIPQPANESGLETYLPVPHDLKNQLDDVNVENVLPGVDLRSSAASTDSGQLVSIKHERIIVPAWTKLAIAISGTK